ncbi:MAG: tagaturonate reductase [Clostridia bacterium]|nr:tagaturonate reductase [Clostridia bacterium]
MTTKKSIAEHTRPARPVKIAQFGGGVFLRGFFDWMLQKANDAGIYNGNAMIIRAKTRGADPLAEQNYTYTHVARDGENCDITVIDSVEGSISPADRPEDLLALAAIPTLETVVSNTTEAGIVYQYCEFSEDSVPETYPARLTRMLYERYRKGLNGLLILPCELIEKNGDTLCEAVKKHAADWSLGDGFNAWMDSECLFRNTLVDRIVSGKTDEEIDVPYSDNEINTSEFFHLWVIEGAEDSRLPFASIGMNIKWVRDVDEYRTLKVRILNGAHTSMIPYALLSGVETVGECMKTPITYNHLRACLFEEIIPSLGEEKAEEAIAYACEVIKRFDNPHICHRCEAISLNSVSKFKVRVLPSILEYRARYGKSPKNLIFALSQLIKFYKEGKPKDDERVIDLMRKGTLSEILSSTELWGEDISFLLPHFDLPQAE